MKKRIISLLLALLMMLSLLPVTAFAERKSSYTLAELYSMVGEVTLKNDRGIQLECHSTESSTASYTVKFKHEGTHGGYAFGITIYTKDGTPSYTPDNNGKIQISSATGKRNTIKGFGGPSADAEYLNADFYISSSGKLAKVEIENTIGYGMSLIFIGHEHKFDTAWETDSSAHWHKCTDEDGQCDIKDYTSVSDDLKNSVAYGAHADTNPQDGICDTCGYHMHDHSLSYSASGNVLTATCGTGSCYLTNSKVTLTLTAGDAIEGTSAYSGASLTGGTAWAAVRDGTTENKLTVPTIYYKGRNGTSYGSTTSAPTNAGYYTATISAGGATATKDFTIGVAKVNGVYYPTLEEAITEAEKTPGTTAKNTVTLLKKVTLTQRLTLTKKIIIDLNQQELDLNKKGLELNSSDLITLKNGTLSGADDTVVNKGKAKLEQVKFEGTVQQSGQSAELEVDEDSEVKKTVISDEALLTLPDGSKVKAQIGTENPAEVEFTKNGKALLKKGKVFAKETNEEAQSALQVPNGEEDPIDVILLPKEQTDLTLYVEVPQDTTTDKPTVGGAKEGDKAKIGGKTVTLKPGADQIIKVTEPLQPFPVGKDITMPKGKTVIINPADGEKSPTVKSGESNTDDVVLTETESGTYPVKAEFKKGDKIIIDKDGTSGQDPVEYTAATDEAELAIDDQGDATLKKGGVELDADEGLYFENTAGEKKVKVKVPSGVKATASAAVVNGQLTYTVDLAATGKIDIGGKEYTVPEGKTATLSVIVDDEGKAKISLISGTVELDNNEEIYVDDIVMKNSTGETITVTDNTETDGDDGIFDVTIGSDTFTYKGAEGDSDLEVKKNSETGAIQFVLDSPNESVKVPGAVTTDTEFVDADGKALVTVNSDSTGDVAVKKSANGFDMVITNEANETSKVKVGECEYGIPEKTETGLSTKTEGDKTYGSLTKGTAEVPGNGGIIFVDDVKVTDNTGDIVPVTDNADSEATENEGQDDGHFTLKSGDDTFKYIAKLGSKDKNEYDKDLTVRENGDSLQLVLNKEDETVELSGDDFNSDIEFTSNETDATDVFVKVDKSSAGDITVTKGSFDVTVENGAGEISKVIVGNTEYTVPANTTTKLTATDDGQNKPAELTSGTVELDKDEEVILKTTGDSYPVKNSDETESVLLVTNDGANGVAQLELPTDGAVTVVDKQYSTLEGKSAKLTATYVEDGTGDVTIEGQKGVKLVLNEGGVSLTKNQTIHTNSTPNVQIENPDETALPVEIVLAGDFTSDLFKDDTLISLKNGQTVLADGVKYVAKSDNSKVIIDKKTGKARLIEGIIELEGGNNIYVDEWKIEVPEDEPSVIITITTPTEIVIPAGGEMIITNVEGKRFHYVNNSAEDIKPKFDENGALTLVLSDNATPSGLPAGSYEAINIRKVGGEKPETLYTFEDDLDTVLARENVAEGDTIVINTDLDPIPSTSAYILTQNKYTIYGVGGDLAKQDKTGTAYSGDYLTVDSRERADYYGVSDMAEALSECMVVRVDAGVVTVQAGEARIVWSKDDTTYYVTLGDALYDASHNKGGSNQYNTHNGRLSPQTIIMNINPYADRENIDIEIGDKLVTCGEDPTLTGDTYIAMMDSHITMYANSNDVYLVDGSLTGEAGKQDTDNTVTIYVAGKGAGYYAQSKSPIIVTASPFTTGLAAVKTTLPLQTVTVGLGNGAKRNNTGLLAGADFSITRVGQVIDDVVNHDTNIAAVVIKTVVKAVTNVFKSIFKR